MNYKITLLVDNIDTGLIEELKDYIKENTEAYLDPDNSESLRDIIVETNN